MIRFFACILAGTFASAALASPADVVGASATRAGSDWTVSATVSHADDGWDHYADNFEVLGPDGTVLATRVLLHPHVDEQPFTRSVGSVLIPDDATSITVRASDNRGDATGKTYRLELSR